MYKFLVMIKFALILVINIFLAITLSVLINTVFDFFSIYHAYSIDVTTDSLKEIRENLLERLSLQKGDLIEALQHLNNVDEELLLLTSNNSSLEYENTKQ